MKRKFQESVLQQKPNLKSDPIVNQRVCTQNIPGIFLDMVSVIYPAADSKQIPVVAVDKVSLHVKTGQVLALLGASGSGKSSLLRAVAGLEATSAGRIFWQGKDMDSVPVWERNFGFVFQDGQLFAHRNVSKNIAYGIECAGIPRTERKQRVLELIKLVNLEGYERRQINTLSGGQQQRVALARALAPKVEILLLDEPFSALDINIRRYLAEELRQIIKQTGVTAVHVTHDREEAFVVADLLAVLHDGELLQVGTPEQVRTHPVNQIVREMVGA